MFLFCLFYQDLVKSHLMYAVREEVDVLREQIKELLEKNNQLEWENQILRQHASPETLAQLAQPRPGSQSATGAPSVQTGTAGQMQVVSSTGAT